MLQLRVALSCVLRVSSSRLLVKDKGGHCHSPLSRFSHLSAHPSSQSVDFKPWPSLTHARTHARAHAAVALSGVFLLFLPPLLAGAVVEPVLLVSFGDGNGADFEVRYIIRKTSSVCLLLRRRSFLFLFFFFLLRISVCLSFYL